MPSRRSRDEDAKSTRSEKNQGASKTGEVFQALAKGIIEYSAQKYLNPKSSSGGSSRDKSARRSTRSRDGTSERKPVSRHGSSSSGETSALLGQIVVGLGAFLFRRYLHHRRERKEKAKEKAKEEARIREARGAGKGLKSDAEIRAGLDALSSETRRTSDSLRHIAGTPPAHPNCEVHGALNQSADRLQSSLSNIQTNVNNVRNLNDDRLGNRRPEERRRRVDGDRARDRDRRIRRRESERLRDRERDADRTRDGDRDRLRRVRIREPERARSMERVSPRWRER